MSSKFGADVSTLDTKVNKKTNKKEKNGFFTVKDAWSTNDCEAVDENTISIEGSKPQGIKDTKTERTEESGVDSKTLEVLTKLANNREIGAENLKDIIWQQISKGNLDNLSEGMIGELIKGLGEENKPNSRKKKEIITPVELKELILEHTPIHVMSQTMHKYDRQKKYYKALIGEEEDIEIRKLIPTKYRKSVDSRTISEAVKWIKSDEMLQVDADLMKKRYKHYFNFKNGVLVANRREFVAHSSQMFLTDYINANYDPDAEGGAFLKTLDDMTGGAGEVKALLRKSYGMVLSNNRDAKKIIFLYGVKDSGKSLNLELMLHLVGRDFCSNIGLHELNDRFKTAQLYGKKLNTFGEMAEINVKRLDIIKALTGNDYLTGEFKGKDPFPFQNRALMVFSCNNLPVLSVRDTSNAFASRLIIVPFLKSIPKSQQDQNLIEKLLGERDFIATWAVEGYRMALEENFDIHLPKISRDILEQYINENRSFERFVEEKCIWGSEYKTYIKEIEHSYYDYCNEKGLQPCERRCIRDTMEGVYRLRYSRFRKDSLNEYGYLGIGLKC